MTKKPQLRASVLIEQQQAQTACKPESVKRFMLTLDNEHHARNNQFDSTLQPTARFKNSIRFGSLTEKAPTAVEIEMKEEDFFMAISGCASTLKKLDKTRQLELKHLRKRSHLKVMRALLIVLLQLDHDDERANYDYRIQQIISKLALYPFLAQLEPEKLRVRVAVAQMNNLQKEKFFPAHGITDPSQEPSSLRYLHKFVACLCLRTIGCQNQHFDQARTLSRFDNLTADMMSGDLDKKKTHDFLKRSTLSDQIPSKSTKGSKLQAQNQKRTEMNLDLNTTTTIEQIMQFHDQAQARSKVSSRSNKQRHVSLNPSSTRRLYHQSSKQRGRSNVPNLPLKQEQKNNPIHKLTMLEEVGESRMPTMNPSPTILSPDGTSSNEHIVLAKKYPDSAERENANLLQLDGEEMGDLEAFIKQEQNELVPTSDGSSCEDYSGRETNFMTALRKDCGRNKLTIGSKQVYACIFTKQNQYRLSDSSNENKMQKQLMLKKLAQGGRFVDQKSLQFMNNKNLLMPIRHDEQFVLPRVNIELALPENVRKLRFNQEQVAERFGRFKDFLSKYEDQICRKKRDDISRIRKAHYEKYGSSSSEQSGDEEQKGAQIGKKASINVSMVQEEVDQAPEYFEINDSKTEEAPIYL